LLADRDADLELTYLDAAFWVKGCSSLGLWRAAVLIELRDRSDRARRKKKKRATALLDIKQAIAPIAPWAPGVEHDLAPAERVLAGARAIAPALGDRMIAASLLDRSV